ncbi:MAG TPA: prolyl oligopeptidase family serine peptidase [Rhizomicrobium sp.]
MALHQLSGPRLPPARGEATHLVVLAHGYGADGNDLIGLAPMWQRLLPTAAFVAPNAPQPCSAGFGYQWFPISRLDPSEMARGVESAAATLENFLEAELTRLNLSGDNLALVGFSQGTMMSLHVGLKRAVKPAAIVGYSGMLADQKAELGPDAPPVLLIHGDADPMIPVGALFAAAATLGGAGAAVQWHIAPGVGHSIDETGLAMGGEFLARAFRGQLARKQAQISCPVG